MAVYDRWHRSFPQPGDQPCKCGRGRHKLYPTAEHGTGKRWQVRGAGHAKRNFHERYGDDPERHAEAYDAQVTAEVNADTYIDDAAGKATLETHANDWLARQAGDPATLETVASQVRRVVAGLGDHELKALAKRPSLTQQWIKNLEAEGLKPGTIRAYVRRLKEILGAAVDDRLIVRNPVDVKSVRAPAAGDGEKIKPWTLAQVDAVAAALPDWYQAMPYVAAGCGLRQGELFGLAKDAVDWLGLEVHVRVQVRLVEGVRVFAPPKGRKERTVPLPDDVSLRLAAHVQEFGTRAVTLPWRKPDGEPRTLDLLFVNSAGRAIRRGSFDATWAQARKTAGRKEGIHWLRHTAASAWLVAGVDINTVAEMLGHQDAGFTLRTYIHMMPNARDRARKAMNAFFAPDAGQSALDVPAEG